MDYCNLCNNSLAVHDLLLIITNGSEFSDVTLPLSVYVPTCKSAKHFGEIFSTWMYEQLSVMHTKPRIVATRSLIRNVNLRSVSINNMAMIMSCLMVNQAVSINISLSILNKAFTYKLQNDVAVSEEILDSLVRENSNFDHLLEFDEDMCYFIAKLTDNCFEFMKSLGSRILSVLIQCDTFASCNNKLVQKMIVHIVENSGGSNALLSDWENNSGVLRNRLLDGSFDDSTSNTAPALIKSEPFFDKEDEVLQYFVTHSHFFRMYREEFDNKLEYKTQVSLR